MGIPKARVLPEPCAVAVTIVHGRSLWSGSAPLRGLEGIGETLAAAAHGQACMLHAHTMSRRKTVSNAC